MRGAILILAICSALQYESAVAQTNDVPSNNTGISSETSDKNEYAFWKYLWPVLRAQRLPVFISYLGTCSDDDGVQVPFPAVDVQSPFPRQTGLAAIRQIFRNAHDVDVKQERSGLMMINIGNAPDALLETRISTLEFDPYEQYDPTMALVAIGTNPDVELGERRLKIDNSKWVEVLHGLSSGPVKQWPHLPPILQNITLRTAMKRLAEKFRGAAIYGACPSELRTELHFRGISDYGGTHFISP
jgi:hypothetical protein